MIKAVSNSFADGLMTRPSRKRAQVAIAIAAAATLALPAPSQANDFGGLIGGVVGGMIGNMQQQQRQYYAPQPQYYAPQPQYYQAQPQYQPQYQQQHSTPHYSNQNSNNAAAAKAAAAKKAKEQEEAKKKEQEAAGTTTAAALPGQATVEPSGVVNVPMTRKNGNLWVSAQINKSITIDFVIDSGASDITLPRDVYLTLMRSGTLTKENMIGNVNFGIADGSEVKGLKFRLNSLQVGNQVMSNVVASVMPSDSATPLLGLSFLSHFQSWAIDNNSGVLKLTPINATPAAAPTQTAAVTPQALPEPPPAAVPQSAAVAPAAVPAAAPQAAAPSQAAAALATTDPASAAQSAAAAPAAQAAAAAPVQTQAPAAPAPAAETKSVVMTMPQMTAPVPMPSATPEAKVASATPDAPRSGRVASSVFLAKEGTPTAPAPAAAPAAPAAAAPAAAAPTQMAAIAAPLPAFPANTAYSNARVGLMALGYSPAAMSEAGKCDANTDMTCFPERLACAKTDSVQCDFMWRRGEQIIKVKTTAIPPTISAVECQVNCK